MIQPKPLQKGDRVAIISLSNGMLGEPYCAHELELGMNCLKRFGLVPILTENARSGMQMLWEHPELRAADLKAAFLDDSISGIICAIGGIDTFRTFPYLLEDAEFCQAVREHPKFFLGYSDTTNNHLMFYRLGLQTFYGQCFLCDHAELSGDMLPYSKEQFESCFMPYRGRIIKPADCWYEERSDYSPSAIGTKPVKHREMHGYELLQGEAVFEGELLGGCIDSLAEMLLSDCGKEYAVLFDSLPFIKPSVFDEQAAVTRKYRIFPNAAEWRGKILFAETSETSPTPERLRLYLNALKSEGVFNSVSGILVGKPMNENYYEEYKTVWRDAVNDPALPILYNVNFGHAAPRAILPYGAKVRVNARTQEIQFL